MSSSAASSLRDNAVSGGVTVKFPRSARLLKHADFRLVYEQGRRHFSTHFTAFYRPNENGAGPRIGYTVSRALGGAVDRNRMKRRLREATRDSWNGFSPARAVDIVVNPKKALLRAEFQDLVAEMRKALTVIEKYSTGANAKAAAYVSGERKRARGDKERR